MRALILVLLASPVVHVQPRAEVQGAVVRLGDVARFDGLSPADAKRLAAVELGRAPAVGTGNLLPRAWLASTIGDAGLPPGTRLDLPARLEITRKAEALGGDAVRKQIEDAVRAALPDEGADDVAAIRVPALPDLRVPAGSHVDVKFADHEDFDGPVPVEVRVTDGDDLVRAQRLTVQIDRFAVVFAATRPLRRGEAVDASALAQRRVPRGEAPPDALAADDPLDGAKLRRDAKPGEVLRRSWLDLPPLVARGDRVTLIARRGALQLTAVGEALGRGALGETVRVRNVGSERIVAGRVAGPQTVEIAF
jgi:flagella basal body P-ring formation protein FlgA